MDATYNKLIANAVKSFWLTKKKQGNVLAGKQLDAFLELLKRVAMDAGVPSDCIYLKNNHVPGYYRASKDWDLLIVSPKKNLIAAIELKSQVGSYGNNLNNPTTLWLLFWLQRPTRPLLWVDTASPTLTPRTRSTPRSALSISPLALWPLLRCLLWLRTFWATSTT